MALKEILKPQAHTKLAGTNEPPTPPRLRQHKNGLRGHWRTQRNAFSTAPPTTVHDGLEAPRMASASPT